VPSFSPHNPCEQQNLHRGSPISDVHSFILPSGQRSVSQVKPKPNELTRNKWRKGASYCPVTKYYKYFLCLTQKIFLDTVYPSTVMVEMCQWSANKIECDHHKQWKKGRLTLSTDWILRIFLLTLRIFLDTVHYPTVRIYLQQILIIHSYTILMYKGWQTLSK
jgi:hypothetical protein